MEVRGFFLRINFPSVDIHAMSLCLCMQTETLIVCHSLCSWRLHIAVPSAQQPVPVVGAPYQIAIFHQIAIFPSFINFPYIFLLHHDVNCN
ncbi:hypothetical protein VN97_g11966 [Penicillium thymicola]|uniref:Uncharacterized protein n=1 Tax=Penicillium thymicola TaxID=293382 RepID=A0AAI9X2F9_PENTH|nr:hypothetical protein VN97_g11966 [Penicillium thymicola]